jgi:hypothetical protein
MRKTAALAGWRQAGHQANAVLAVEASAPMAGPGSGTRDQLVAALAAGLIAQATPTDRLGLWTYGLAAPEHRIVAFGPLDDATRESLADGARALDAAPGQGSRTALYDTVFAAKQKLQNQLGRDETGSIVLFSRGTDDASRISEQQLLPEFRARVGPKIRVVAVRIGPAPSAAQPDPLRDLADASGGEVLSGASATPDALMAAMLNY